MRTTAGAGTGSKPCSQRTTPRLRGIARHATRSTPSSANPDTTPTTSAIASSAPTS